MIDWFRIYTYLGPFSAEPENVTHAPIAKGSKVASGNLGRTTPKSKQDGQGYRRKRTAFSIRQLQKLETAFQWNMYPGVNVRESLATELGISEACVQVRRRQFFTLKGICHAICYLFETIKLFIASVEFHIIWYIAVPFLLLQWMERMDMDQNLKKLRQPFQVLMLCLRKLSKKINPIKSIWYFLPNATGTFFVWVKAPSYDFSTE